MKLLGETLFERDATGRLKARVGTVFLRTPGLVTAGTTHFLQRDVWVEALNRDREQAGLPRLTEDEDLAERERSVDLLVSDQFVLIRPDPHALQLAFEADELLQTLVSKRRIRYLNIQNPRVRDALTARGENWRMSRVPVSTFELNNLIAGARTALGHAPLYFYNRSTGTRFLTLGSFRWVGSLPDGEFRDQLREIAAFAARRNRFGHPEVDVFPPGCAFTRQAFEALDADGLDGRALRAAYARLLDTFAGAVPKALQRESPDNAEWRNLLCTALTSEPFAMATEEILPGISQEFYRQIEWLPGVRTEGGETIFDPVFDEPDAFPDDAELRTLCDPRAHSVLYNYLRERSDIEHINIGRITRSLSHRTAPPAERSNVYVVQVKEAGQPEAELHILRFQKWSIHEHLDTKPDWDEIRCILDASGYIDYVFDRRLGCQQLGMSLPRRMTIGRLREVYQGRREHLRGKAYWIVYFIRDYVKGCASDKLAEERYADPEFGRRLARLLGDAAAVNLAAGRAGLDGQPLFDDGDEVIVDNPHGLPDRLVVSDITGAFTDYTRPLAEFASFYAAPVNRRESLLPDAAEFAEIYLDALRHRFERLQQEYASRRRAFDSLFKHLPVDPNGSIAYRWQRALARLAETDAAALTAAVRSHIRVLRP